MASTDSNVDTYRKDAHVVELVQEQSLVLPPCLIIWGEELARGQYGLNRIFTKFRHIH